jgi:hypothetical protein
MIVMFTMTYPTTSAVEYANAVLKNFQENPFPDFMKMTGAYSVLCENGMKSYAIVEVEAGREDEAFKIFNKRMANYMSIPGFGFREERLLNAEESFALGGFKGS